MLYLHCKRCYEEKPSDLSMREWARLDVGYENGHVFVRCVRHDLPVSTFKGQPHLPSCGCAACGAGG
jgi:hypothetical protein